MNPHFFYFPWLIAGFWQLVTIPSMQRPAYSMQNYLFKNSNASSIDILIFELFEFQVGQGPECGYTSVRSPHIQF